MKGLIAGVLAATASATDLKLTWQDCGDSSTKVKISSFTPDSITLGQKSTMVGSGALPEDVSGATYDLEMTGAIGTLLSCKGDASQAKTCGLPLGTGSLTFEAMNFPLKAGTTDVKVDIQLSANLPAGLATTTTKVTSVTTSGDKLFCIQIKSAKAEHRRRSEVLSREETEKLGVAWRGNSSETSSHALLGAPKDYPADFSWCNKDGKSYCTMSRNQHIPQYCGSCWAHGAISALGDRVKIARGAEGVDINLAVQHVLNCGGVGSCHGGTVDGTYQWIHSISQRTGTGVSYETANPYIACSSESKEGFCPHADTTCKPINVARTCGSFDQEGGSCTGLSNYPNVTVAEYGSISGKEAMMKEIFNRGPIACGIDAMPLLNFETGIATKQGSMVDHVISVVGWGTDKESNQQYWIVRNSWGEYWGDMGYVKVAFGALAVEEQCSWAVPATYTSLEKNNQVHCHEGGDNCKAKGPSTGIVV